MNSFLFCTLLAVIIYISSSNASSSSSGGGRGGRAGYGGVTYGKERGNDGYSNYGQARDTKDRIYEGSNYGKARGYDDDYDNQRKSTRGYSTRGGGSSGSSSSSGGRRTGRGDGSGSGSGSRSGRSRGSRSVSRGRRSNNGRDTRYGKGRDDGRDNKGYDDGLIASLIQMNVDLYKKIKYLKKEVTTISEIKPSFLGLNYAICVGPVEEDPRRRRMQFRPSTTEESPSCKIGTICAYAGEKDDLEGSNYLLADGEEINKDDYPVLAAILSEKFGNSEDCDKCKLPDLRGRFILGVGDGFNIGDFGGDLTDFIH